MPSEAPAASSTYAFRCAYKCHEALESLEMRCDRYPFPPNLLQDVSSALLPFYTSLVGSHLSVEDRPGYFKHKGRKSNAEIQKQKPNEFVPYHWALVTPTMIPPNLRRLPFLVRVVDFPGPGDDHQHTRDLLLKRPVDKWPKSWEVREQGQTEASRLVVRAGSETRRVGEESITGDTTDVWSSAESLRDLKKVEHMLPTYLAS